MKTLRFNETAAVGPPITRRQAIAGAAAYLAALFNPPTPEAEWEMVNKIEAALEEQIPEREPDHS